MTGYMIPLNKETNMQLGKAIAALIEKALWTFVEVFAATVAVASQMGADTLEAAAAGGVAAAITVVANGMPQAEGLPFGLDLLYRVFRSGAASVLATVGATSVFDWNVGLWENALMRAGPPVFVILKGAAAERLGQKGTAATLPASLDVPPPYQAAA